MDLPPNLFATAFRRQRLGLMLFFLVGIMVYLGSLAMAAQAVLARTSLAWGHDLQYRLTAEIAPRSGEKPDALAARAEKVVAFLKERPEVRSVALRPEPDTARLLGPWIEDGELLRSLALPRLVEIALAPGAQVDPEALRESVKPLAGDIRFHPHERGMAQAIGFLRGLGALASLMLVLTGLSVVAIITIICRAAMSAQRETIELLHYMGATDGIVARQFQSYVRRLAFPSASIGFVLAALTVLGLAFLLGSLGGLSLVSSVSWATAFGMMAVVPVAAVLLAAASARLSVQGFLRRLL